MNVVFVHGRLEGPLRAERDKATGASSVSFVLRVLNDDGEPEAVPVIWYDGPERPPAWATDQELFVSGRVRRRFVQQRGSRTGSRTEVVAVYVSPGDIDEAAVEGLENGIRRMHATLQQRRHRGLV